MSLELEGSFAKGWIWADVDRGGPNSLRRERLPRLYSQPHPNADDQRSDL